MSATVPLPRHRRQPTTTTGGKNNEDMTQEHTRRFRGWRQANRNTARAMPQRLKFQGDSNDPKYSDYN